MLIRRDSLLGTAAVALVANAVSIASAAAQGARRRSPDEVARDELFWMSVARNMAYQEHAHVALNDLFARIGPAVVAKQRISVAEFDAIPAFTFQDRSLSQKVASFAAPLGFLALLSAVLLIAARQRLRAARETALESPLERFILRI